MVRRDELFQKFGPLLFEAFAIIVKDEVNDLRVLHGLSPRTNIQIINKLDTVLDGLQKYDWMTNSVIKDTAPVIS